METVRFWYTFEDEGGDMSNSDVEVTLSRDCGVRRDEICEAFVRFLNAAGYSTEGLKEMFDC